MKISIVTPCYNAEKYLSAYFDSIIKQTYKNFEVICVDDGSTDKTWELLQEYSQIDSRIRVYQMTENSGVCKIPREKAIELATTEWCIAIDSDDFIEPNYVKKLVERQIATGADVVTPCCVLYDEKAKKKELNSIPSESFDYSKILTGRESLMLTLGCWQIPMGGALIKRSIYQKLSRYMKKDVEVGKQNSDEYDSREILTKSKLVAFANAKYFYRQNPASVTHQTPDLFLTHRTDEDLHKLMVQNYGANSREAKAAMAAYIRNVMRTLHKQKVYHPDVIAAMHGITIKNVISSESSLSRKLRNVVRLLYYKLRF